MGPPSSTPFFFLTHPTLVITKTLHHSSSRKGRMRGQSVNLLMIPLASVLGSRPRSSHQNVSHAVQRCRGQADSRAEGPQSSPIDRETYEVPTLV